MWIGDDSWHICFPRDCSVVDSPCWPNTPRWASPPFKREGALSLADNYGTPVVHLLEGFYFRQWTLTRDLRLSRQMGGNTCQKCPTMPLKFPRPAINIHMMFHHHPVQITPAPSCLIGMVHGKCLEALFKNEKSPILRILRSNSFPASERCVPSYLKRLIVFSEMFWEMTYPPPKTIDLIFLLIFLRFLPIFLPHLSGTSCKYRRGNMKDYTSLVLGNNAL